MSIFPILRKQACKKTTSKVGLWPCSAETSPKWQFIDCTLRKPPAVIRQPIRSHGPRIMRCIDPINWRSPGVFFHTWSLSRVELFCSAQSWLVFSHIFFIFAHFSGKISNFTHIFQRGWNHQLGKFLIYLFFSSPGVQQITLVVQECPMSKPRAWFENWSENGAPKLHERPWRNGLMPRCCYWRDAASSSGWLQCDKASRAGVWTIYGLDCAALNFSKVADFQRLFSKYGCKKYIWWVAEDEFSKAWRTEFLGFSG